MKSVIKINKISKYLLSLVAVVALGCGSRAFCMDIFTAITEKNIDRVREIIKDKSFDVNKVNGLGETPLHWACWINNLNMVRLLLDNGAKEFVNKVDSCGRTPLDEACFHNNLEMLKLLLEFGADVDQIALNIAQINSQDPTKQAIATQKLNTFNLTRRFDAYKKAGAFFNLTPEEQNDKNLSEFADRLAKSVRAELLDKEFRKSGSGKFSKVAKEGKGQKYFDTNIKFSN